MSDLQRYMNQAQAYVDPDYAFRLLNAQRNAGHDGPGFKPMEHYAPTDTTRITGPKVRPPDGQ